jgi:superfamily I DNA/RNA helicase
VKPLGTVTPTPEQLTVIEDGSPGFWLVRGSAGSGKTTTALLRLKFLVRLWRERARDLGLEVPVRVLVLTFNRTLRGYIEHLAAQQVALGADVALEVDTFGFWAQHLVNEIVLDQQDKDAKIVELARQTDSLPRWEQRFLLGEVDYVLGRLLPDDLDRYADPAVFERTGRGRAPTVTRSARQRLLDGVIYPYRQWKETQGVYDWNDLAVVLATEQLGPDYNVVVVDESQDFSANQVRAIVNHLADDHVTTFIRDASQRIFAHSFTWSDVGITIPQAQNKKLEINYRNTKQIAAFAKPLLDGVEPTEDSALPDFDGCVRTGPKPVVLRGLYNEQVDWVVDYLRSGQIGADETVAFLHPLGWFNYLTPRLDVENLEWAKITATREWPDGPEQLAVSTMASAKGLEFDHVVIIGYNGEVVRHGDEPDDALLDEARRLLAMAVSRARKSVVLGYKPADEPAPVALLNPATYDAINL